MNIFKKIIILSSIFTYGCAPNPIYNDIKLDILSNGNSKILVGTTDNRSYVKNEDKTDKFIGLIKGGYGIPISVKTVSDKPLSLLMSEIIVKSLNKKGFESSAIDIDYKLNTEDAKNFLINHSKSDAYFLLTLNKWKSHTRAATSLTYDVTFDVLNSSGSIISSKTIEGRENSKEKSLFNAWSIAEKFIANTTKNKLEDLINDTEIQKNITGNNYE